MYEDVFIKRDRTRLKNLLSSLKKDIIETRLEKRTSPRKPTKEELEDETETVNNAIGILLKGII